MPTGQAVAERLGLPPLTPAELEAAAASTAPGQGAARRRVPPAHAALVLPAGRGQAPRRPAARPGGQHHGRRGAGRPGPAQRRLHPALAGLGAVAARGQAGPLHLADLLRFAKVVGGGAAPRTYKVKKGDTLSGIAARQLGKADRWPELFVLNRARIRHRDRLTPGQVLTLPGAAPIKPRPELYKVKKGDTLSGIAAKKLGDANRWPEIARLNRDIVPDPDEIVLGQVLVILKR